MGLEAVGSIWATCPPQILRCPEHAVLDPILLGDLEPMSGATLGQYSSFSHSLLLDMH